MAITDPLELVVRPIVEGQIRGFAKEHPGVLNGVTPTVRVGKRENTQNAATYTAAASPSSLTGLWRITASGRVHEFEVTLTQSAGTAWEHMQGLDIQAARLAGMK